MAKWLCDGHDALARQQNTERRNDASRPGAPRAPWENSTYCHVMPGQSTAAQASRAALHATHRSHVPRGQRVQRVGDGARAQPRRPSSAVAAEVARHQRQRAAVVRGKGLEALGAHLRGEGGRGRGGGRAPITTQRACVHRGFLAACLPPTIANSPVVCLLFCTVLPAVPPAAQARTHARTALCVAPELMPLTFIRPLPRSITRALCTKVGGRPVALVTSSCIAMSSQLCT